MKFNYLLSIVTILIFPLNISAFDTVMNSKIWTFDSYSSSVPSQNIHNINGLYYYGKDICISEQSSEGKFSDSESWSSEYSFRINKSDSDLQLVGVRKLAGQNYNNISEIIAFNTYCAGTCYIIASSDTSDIGSSMMYIFSQYRGFNSKWESDAISSVVNQDFTELKLYCPSAGSFWITTDNPSKIYAIRFEPDSNDIVSFNTSVDTSVHIVKNSIGNYFIDFFKDAFGQIELTLTSLCENDTVTIHLGECCKDEFVVHEPGGSRRYQSIKIPLKKGTHTYRPNISWPGYSSGLKALYMPIEIGEVMPFRYCEIEGYKQNIDYNDIVRHTIFCGFEDDLSYFHCNDDTLNKIWELCKYSIKATSFMGYYIDGDRERCPYEADALINQLSNFACDNNYSISKRTIEYLLRNPSWPSEWVMQTVMLAWNHYLFSGDDEILKKYTDLLKAHTLIDFVDQNNGLVTTTSWGQDPDKLKVINRDGIIQDIVDWPQDSDELFDFKFSDYNTVVNAYHYQTCKLMALIYEAIGQYDNHLEMIRYCENFKLLFNKMFLDHDKGLYKDGVDINNNSFHSNIFALCFGLVPQEHIEKVISFIESKGMACSVYGSQFLLEALYNYGRQENAFDLLTASGERSWLNMIKEGSTITTEAWSNRLKPNQDWNHAWGAAPANIIQFQLLGIYPQSPGFKEFIFEPKIGDLTDVDTSLPTINGSIKASIHKDECSFSINVNIPTEMHCDIILPYNVQDFMNLKIDGQKTLDYSIIHNKIHIHRINGKHIIELNSLTTPNADLNFTPVEQIDNGYYDLMGRKVIIPLSKGIYISNKKKILIR